ncbi:MAG: putative caspase-like protein [Hyphomicrobiaceae bacterium]|jgi:uncharacterized caspase-like protein
MAVSRWQHLWYFVLCFVLVSCPAGNAFSADARGLSFVPSEVSTGNYYEKSWAVLIGINDYESNAVSDLQYARSDVDAMRKSLVPLGFPEEQIFTLTGAEATREAISRLLNERLRTVTGPEDRVLVFFAGHGLTQDLPRGGEEGYLLPVDGDPNALAATAFSMGDIRAISRRLPAKHILYIVDACYSGMSLQRSARTLGPVSRRYLDLVTSDPVVQILTAGSKEQPVVEENGHGVFTSVLLSALLGHADLDGNNVLTADEVAAWVRPRVAQATNFRQTPQFGSLDGAGQFTFVLHETAETISPTNDDSPGSSVAGPKPVSPDAAYDVDEKPSSQPIEPERALPEGTRKPEPDPSLPSGLPPF